MSEKKKTWKHYSKEFKAEAVAKCSEIGINATSRELGVSIASLRIWRDRANSESSSENKPSYADLERENRKLRKELGYVKDINEVLKKSTAIFSSKEMGGLQ